MDTSTINIIRQDIINNHLLIKAMIEDIKICHGPLELLNLLNADGRGKIAVLRKLINELDLIGREQETLSNQREVLQEVASHRQQLASTVGEFRKANMACFVAIQKNEQKELFDDGNADVTLRHRKRKDKESLVRMSSNVSEQLLSISRHLADTTQRSAGTLDALVNSSTTVGGTQEELQATGGVIFQSSKLLAKYGRRELTDKVLLFFAFAFFLACVFYIVSKRLF